MSVGLCVHGHLYWVPRLLHTLPQVEVLMVHRHTQGSPHGGSVLTQVTPLASST